MILIPWNRLYYIYYFNIMSHSFANSLNLFLSDPHSQSQLFLMHMSIVTILYSLPFIICSHWNMEFFFKRLSLDSLILESCHYSDLCFTFFLIPLFVYFVIISSILCMGYNVLPNISLEQIFCIHSQTFDKSSLVFSQTWDSLVVAIYKLM